MLLAYLYSAGTQHGNLPPAGWPILFCRPTQELCVSQSQHRQNREKFLKKCTWMDRKAESIACLAIYWPTPGFKGRTFKLCVLTRWDFNFCVRSSPLRDVVNKADLCDKSIGPKVLNTSHAKFSLLFVGEEQTNMAVPWAAQNGSKNCTFCILVLIEQPNEACRRKYFYS